MIKNLVVAAVFGISTMALSEENNIKSFLKDQGNLAVTHAIDSYLIYGNRGLVRQDFGHKTMCKGLTEALYILKLIEANEADLHGEILDRAVRDLKVKDYRLEFNGKTMTILSLAGELNAIEKFACTSN